MLHSDFSAGIPMDVFHRLPKVLNALNEFTWKGRAVVSAAHLADQLGLPLDELRAVLAYVVGLESERPNWMVEELAGAIRRALGWSEEGRAILVGAGRLAETLLNHPAFRTQAVALVAVFDADPAHIGQEVGGVIVLPLEKIESLAPRVHAQLGIVALPVRLAQDAADRLIAAGVRTLWNLTSCRLRVPDEITVIDADLAEGVPVLRPAASVSMA